MVEYIIKWLTLLLTIEAIPGSIRKAEFFISFMKRFNEYLKVCSVTVVTMVTGDMIDEASYTEGNIREPLIISTTLSTVSLY